MEGFRIWGERFGVRGWGKGSSSFSVGGMSRVCRAIGSGVCGIFCCYPGGGGRRQDGAYLAYWSGVTSCQIGSVSNE